MEASQTSLHLMNMGERAFELSQPWKQLIPHPLHAHIHACTLLHAIAHDAA